MVLNSGFMGRKTGQLLLLAGVVLCLVLPCYGFAQVEKGRGAGTGRARIEYGYPDQSIFVAAVNDAGHAETPMKRVAEALMTRAGVPWHAVPYPARRLFDNLNKGITDFSILVRASSLKDSCIFSRKPIYSTSLNIYYLGEKPPIRSREDLAGKSLFTIRGYSYAGLRQFIRDPANRVMNEIAGTHKAAFAMLKNDRADYLMDYASAADDILSENPMPGIRSTSIDQLDIFLVLSKSYPDAEEFMAELETIAAGLDIPAILKGRAK